MAIFVVTVVVAAVAAAVLQMGSSEDFVVEIHLQQCFAYSLVSVIPLFDGDGDDDCDDNTVLADFAFAFVFVTDCTLNISTVANLCLSLCPALNPAMCCIPQQHPHFAFVVAFVADLHSYLYSY